MKNFFLIVTIISLSLVTPKIQAEINMKDASYKNSFIDIHEIRRTYNSRSIYNGIFGFGWCSEYEISLNILSKKEILLKNCDLESPFVLMDENNLLKTRRYENPITKENIIFKNELYTHYLNGGSIQIFDRSGKMLSMETSSDRTTLVYSRNGNLIQIKTNRYQLRFDINDVGHVIKVETSSGDSVLYTYENENLIESTEMGNEITSYEYDSLNNIIKVIYPDSTTENIAYNNDSDRVTKIELRDHCKEYYDFYNKNNDPLYQVSTLIRKCDNKTIHQYVYKFWYKYRSDGLKYLERYRVDQKNQSLDITYNPYDGNPVRILKNGKILI